MKTKIPCFALLVLTAVALAGCGKKDEPTDVQPDAAKTGTSVAEAAGKTVEAAKTEAAKVTETVKTEAQTATASATSQAQGFIDKAKALVAEKKFQDASAALQQLGNLALTPEQQKIVNELKEQIAKGLAAASGAGSAVENLLKK